MNILQNSQDPEQAQREQNLMLSPDAQDEPSAMPLYVGDVVKAKRDFVRWSEPDKYQQLETEAKKREYI